MSVIVVMQQSIFVYFFSARNLCLGKFVICTVYVLVKGCGMGPLLVLVSPCFRENVVVTCKIGSFFVV